MTPREVIKEAASHGVALSIHDGRLRYQGEAQAVAAVLPLLQEHKTAIINELSGGPAGSPAPSPDQWQCPTGYARHREYWISDYGLRICSTCHPAPSKGGASWRQ
ncbi:MAG: hypothetical protein Q7J24_06055 [Desulfomicrobium sp.]|nr:hypothetical protein [Desulfomicrobium sp.]